MPRMLKNSICDIAELPALCKSVVFSGNGECERPTHSIGCSGIRALLKWQRQCKAPRIGNTTTFVEPLAARITAGSLLM
jgi:hypothetical protein